MFALEPTATTPGKMEARKELRMHRADEERIRAAAAATGLQEADFIRQAAAARAGSRTASWPYPSCHRKHSMLSGLLSPHQARFPDAVSHGRSRHRKA
jgi:hypothetical protein